MADFTEKYQQEIERLIKASVRDIQLQTELIDHCCCSIEEQLLEGHSFDDALSNTLRNLAPNGIHEIEEQVQFILTPQIPFTMKITQYFFGFVATVCVLLGITFKTLHWPMASHLLFIGFVSLATSMMALITSAIKFPTYYTYRSRTLIGAIGGFIFSIGSLFKLMHWPGANMMALLGMLIITLVFAPMLFWQLYQYDNNRLRKAE